MSAPWHLHFPYWAAFLCTRLPCWAEAMGKELCVMFTSPQSMALGRAEQPFGRETVNEKASPCCGYWPHLPFPLGREPCLLPSRDKAKILIQDP